jgi:hypothetical protein
LPEVRARAEEVLVAWNMRPHLQRKAGSAAFLARNQ